MGDTVFLGSQCEEIIVTATLFVIDVYLASDSYTLVKPTCMVEVFFVQGSYTVEIRNSMQRQDLIDRSSTLQKNNFLFDLLMVFIYIGL